MSKTPAIIVDLDGTLCDCRHRRHFVERPKGTRKDWKSFFASMHLDEPNLFVAYLIDRLMFDGIPVLFVTGRDEEHRKTTVNWLGDHLPTHGMGLTALFMRPAKDNREDSVVKREIYENYIKDHYDVKLVLDDRTRVVNMWRDLGLECWQVASGDF